MPGPAPKPDADRRRRNEPTFEWVPLPADGRQGPPPALPSVRDWSQATLDWWADLWASPQADAWDQSGRTAWPMAVLFEDMLNAEQGKVSGTLAELRAHEDRHGLNPKAMLQLRWRIVDGETATVTPKKPTQRRRDPRLKALPGGKQGA